MATKKAKDSNIELRRRQARELGDHDYEQKRKQLFSAAGRIFREKGFERASMTDFAKAIGIDRASIYYYTSGKTELFQEVVQDAVSDNVKMIEAIDESDTEPLEKIEAFIVGLMKSYEQHYPYLYVYIQEDMSRISSENTEWAREMAALSQRFTTVAYRIVQEAIDSGAIRAKGTTAKMIVFAILGMCNWSHRWYRPSGEYDCEAIGRQFSSMLLHGLV